jgi:uncharacterized protein involved in exopolysaccharide biosynthesis
VAASPQTFGGYDELDASDLALRIWRGRWIIIAVTLLCAVTGASYALLAREWYKAEISLLQADRKSVSSTLSQIGGLASLAGIDLGTGSSESQMSLAVLKSSDTARAFIEERNLVPVVLFEQWDSVAHKWKQSGAKTPDIRDAVQRFKESIRQISEDRRTGVVTLSITWTDSETAANWANEYVVEVNNRLRRQAEAEAEANIAYLRKELESTNVTALQQSLGRVLEVEMQKLLIARGTEQFAFRIIDKAVPPKRRFSPKKMQITGLSGAVGLVLSVLYVLMRGPAGRRNQST